MCPICMTSIALMATGGSTAGGLAALVMTRFRCRKSTSIQSGKSERKDESSQATGTPTKETTMTEASIPHPEIVSRAEWQVAHDKLLVKEKAATRARDALAAERRRLPRLRIEKHYVFEGSQGTTFKFTKRSRSRSVGRSGSLLAKAVRGPATRQRSNAAGLRTSTACHGRWFPSP